MGNGSGRQGGPTLLSYSYIPATDVPGGGYRSKLKEEDPAATSSLMQLSVFSDLHSSPEYLACRNFIFKAGSISRACLPSLSN